MEACTEDIAGDVEEEAEGGYEQILGEVGLEMVNGEAVPSGKLKAGATTHVSDFGKQLHNRQA